MRLLPVIPPLVLLAACATDPGSSSSAPIAGSTGREEKIVCGKEEPTGSRLRVQRCWTQEQLDQETREAKSAIERVQSVRPNPEQPIKSR